MSDILTHIRESIPGIWDSGNFKLVLSLDNTFFLETKETEDIIDGFYLILQIPKNRYYTLRLTEINGTTHDYDIIDVIVFDTLIISRNGERLHFTNVPPDEYEGEIFNPANN